jgi:subtilisin family serine protease
MMRYVLSHRRSGKFTDEAKIASRDAVRATLKLLSSARVVADHPPADRLARRVVLIDAAARQVAALRGKLPPDAILEAVVPRYLHGHVPAGHRPAAPRAAAAKAGAAPYTLTVTGKDQPLAKIEVKLYLRGPGGRDREETLKTDAKGKLSCPIPRGFRVMFVKPIPYARFWTMWKEEPQSDIKIDCPAIAAAGPGGGGWWHDVMNIDVTDSTRGAGIRVGVIDTGCGPHRNLVHVTRVGAFVDGRTLPPREARDVGHHGTHITGIIGARPTEASDYAGIAPGCDLFHARAFPPGPAGWNPHDIAKAIDSLSETHQCDLINMSFGGPESKVEEDAVQAAAEGGTLCVCSAGNTDSIESLAPNAVTFPAAYPRCVAVSAIGKVGQAPAGTFAASNCPRAPAKMGEHDLFLANFSRFGPALACAAPGVGIVSTVPDRAGLVGAYMEEGGTSQACAAACGVLAVILSQDPIYRGLPRDTSRVDRANLVLSQHCKPIGLPARFEGHGVPTA